MCLKTLCVFEFFKSGQIMSMDSSYYMFGMIIFMRLHFNHKFDPQGLKLHEIFSIISALPPLEYLFDSIN